MDSMMTNSQFELLKSMVEDVRHLLELQNGRVRKNSEEISAYKEWRNSEWLSFKQGVKDDNKEIKDVLSQKLMTMSNEISEIKQSLSGLRKEQEKQSPYIEFVRKYGFPILVIIILIADRLDISIF